MRSPRRCWTEARSPTTCCSRKHAKKTRGTRNITHGQGPAAGPRQIFKFSSCDSGDRGSAWATPHVAECLRAAGSHQYTQICTITDPISWEAERSRVRTSLPLIRTMHSIRRQTPSPGFRDCECGRGIYPRRQNQVGPFLVCPH